ncbi:MAG: hypothetical protein ACYCUD_13135 [Candidatus Dormibacteria bacterium]
MSRGAARPGDQSADAERSLFARGQTEGGDADILGCRAGPAARVPGERCANKLLGRPEPLEGHALEQWQREMTGAGRVRYAIDPGGKRVWVTRAVPATRPKQTDTAHSEEIRGKRSSAKKLA